MNYKRKYLKQYLSEKDPEDITIKQVLFEAKYTNNNHNDTQQLVANICGYSPYYDYFEISCWGIDKEEFLDKSETDRLEEVEHLRDMYELWEADTKEALRYLIGFDCVDFDCLTNKK